MRMSKKRPIVSLLLAALLAAQALNLAHAFDHPAADHADHACAVCAHGSGLDHSPPAAAETALAARAAPVAITMPPAPKARIARTNYDSRAPPLPA